MNTTRQPDMDISATSTTSTTAHTSMLSWPPERKNPLDSYHIRLVQLQPALRKVEIINCSTIVVPFEKAAAVQYEAISYAWGGNGDMRLILVDGTEHEVTKNLYDALRRLRRSHHPRMLWIDQISINQSDDVEKSGQVAMMPYIFSAAEVVLAWLGDGDYAELFALLNDEERMASALTTLQTADKTISLVRDYWKEAGYMRVDVELHNCLFSLLSLVHSPWFARVWILQEIARAKSIQLLSGPDCAEWYDFTSLLQCVDRCCTYNAKLQLPMDIAWNIAWLRNSYKLMSPSEIILAGRYSRSSKPVDQIYALLALVPENGSAEDTEIPVLPLDVDYALPVVEVYSDATLKAITTDRRISVLSLLARGTPEVGLPSWVPDYSLVTSTIALSYFDGLRRCFLDVNRFQAEVQAGSGRGALLLRGVEIGTLHYTSWTLDIGSDRKKYVVYRRWLAHSQKFMHRSNKNAVMAAFRETLIPGEWIERSEPHPSAAVEEGFREWTEHINRGTLPPRASMAEHVSHYIEQCCAGRKFATTQRGEPCLVPGESIFGDSILLLGGGKLPFIARPNGDSYRLIGECFIHGKDLNAIMEGNENRTFTFI